MANKSTKVLNVFISFGIIFFIAVCVFAFLREELLTTNSIIVSILLLQILFGAIVINTAILLTHKAYQIFLGLLIGGWGILLYLMHFVLPFTMFQLWPVFLIFAGIFLIISGIYRYKKFKFGFGIPAITLICMGLWYMLFSFKIIKIPFSVVATVIGPLFMLIIAVILVLFFLVSQKHAELIVNDDVHGDFGDEELERPKIGK